MYGEFLQMCVPTTGEELWLDGGNELPLQRLGEGALGVLDRDAPLFDPTQQPQEVAVTQQVRRLKLPADAWKRIFHDFNSGRHNHIFQYKATRFSSYLQRLQRHQAV